MKPLPDLVSLEEPVVDQAVPAPVAQRPRGVRRPLRMERADSGAAQKHEQQQHRVIGRKSEA